MRTSRFCWTSILAGALFWNTLFNLDKRVFRQKGYYDFNYTLQTDGRAVAVLRVRNTDGGTTGT